MKIEAGDYTIEKSDIIVRVHKVMFRTNEYIKIKATLINKKNNIHYETKTYKLFLDKIKHWKKLE